MKTIRSIVLVIPLLTVSLSLSGQTLTTKQQRNMNMRLLELVEKYEMYSLAYDKAAVYSFIDLFENKDTEVYNDMLEFPEKAVPVETYIRNLSKQENISVVIKNVGRGDYEYLEGAWHCAITFEKEISYNDANAVLFSSSEYYGKDYVLTLDCKYIADKDRFVIAGIDGKMNSSVPHLPAEFDVIAYNTKQDNKLSSGGNPLKFNSFDQAFVPKNAIRPWNDDVRIKRTISAATDKYELVRLNFKYTHLRAKAKFTCSAGSVFSLSSPVDFSTKKSFGYEIGADFGYAIPFGKRMTMSIYTGIAYSSSKLSLTSGGYEYSYMTSSHSGEIYNRSYKIESMTEGVNYSDIVVPLYFQFDHRLTKDLLLSWDLGIKAYFNVGIKLTPYHVKAVVSGDLANPSPEDAFEEIDRDFSAFLFPANYGRAAADLSAVAGFGLNYNVYKGLVYVYAKVSFEYGVTKIHASENSPIYSEDGMYPLVYSSMDGGKNIATRSYWDCISFHRQAFWPELGVMLKF